MSLFFLFLEAVLTDKNKNLKLRNVKLSLLAKMIISNS